MSKIKLRGDTFGVTFHLWTTTSYISRHIPLVEGRFKMLRYLQEQSLSIDYHRYGNMGEREF